MSLKKADARKIANIIANIEGKTKVLACTCSHKSQDEMYGQGMRLHNRGKAKDGVSAVYRCTVCGKER